MLAGQATIGLAPQWYEPSYARKDPRQGRRAGDTHACNLSQIQRIRDVPPLLPQAVVGSASFAGLRLRNAARAGGHRVAGVAAE